VSGAGYSLRQACLGLVAPAVASGAVPPGLAPRVAELWAEFVATGRVPSRRVALSLHPGPSAPAPQED
jgi:hypothetical protein